MSLVEINWRPEKKELRKFGLIALVITAAVFCVLHFLLKVEAKWAAVLFSIGAIIFLVSLISAKATRIVYLALTFAALPIGLVVSFLLLSLFYFLILTPVGILFRLIGRDVLNRKFKPDGGSYWVKRRGAESAERYFHQF